MNKEVPMRKKALAIMVGVVFLFTGGQVELLGSMDLHCDIIHPNVIYAQLSAEK